MASSTWFRWLSAWFGRHRYVVTGLLGAGQGVAGGCPSSDVGWMALG